MIRETYLEITDTQKRWQAELQSRRARREKVRYIDHLLNELEMLNLAESASMPVELSREVKGFLQASEHPLGRRAAAGLVIADSMEALYEIQDTLMVSSEDEEH